MSANATSLRRILRSIGSHASPSSTNTTRNPSNLTPYSNTRTHSQDLGRSGTCQHATHSRQKSSKAASNSSVHPSAQAELIPENRSAGPTRDRPTDGDLERDIHAESGKRRSTNDAKGTDQPGQRRVFRYIKDGQNVIRRVDSTAKSQDGFRKQFFLHDQARENVRTKKRARQSQLAKERHELPDERAWQEILRFLEQDSPHGATEYTKRMETIRLPKGVYARWTGDAGESILEIMQRTGSHVQVIPIRNIGLFSSLTLLGRPAQNAAAKRFLQESELLQAVSEDDHSAPKSLADYDLRSEVSDRHGEALMENEGREEANVPSNDLLDDIDEARLQNAVISTTGHAPTRAVWSKASSVPEAARTGNLNPSSLVSKTPNLSRPLSAISLTARVEQLTAESPRRARRNQQPGLTASDICDELVALTTNKDHSASITPLAASKTLEYLAHHMFFPAAREVLNSLKDFKVRLSADIFNTLLGAAARSENVQAFHYIVSAMRNQGVSPNAGTWVQFHVLMLKRFPAKVDQVMKIMREKAVRSDLSARIDSIETYSAVLLASYFEAYPGASLKDFIDQMNRDNPGVRWLTSYSANKICHHLIRNGRVTMAYEVVDELVRRGGRPDAVTLNTFLSAARRDGDMELAISVLRRFHDLHASSTPLAETTRERFIALPRAHDLSISPNNITMKTLCSLAWARKDFNCFRVFWRYACCTGHVGSDLIKKMRFSILSKGALEDDIGQTSVETKTRARLWNALAARFAMGVKAGLDSQRATKIFDAARGVRVSDADKGVPSDVAERVTLGQGAATSRRLRIMQKDTTENQSLQPTEHLVDLAEKALRKDRAWKDQLIGLPKGLPEYTSLEHMFEIMLKDGVEVPVEVGDATGMKL